jgi:hypothetical protein
MNFEEIFLPSYKKKMDADNMIFKSVQFVIYPSRNISSMATAPLPQSLHDATAIPSMNSALVNKISCLQFGHL